MTAPQANIPQHPKSDLKILVVEDNPTDRELLRFLLEARLTPDSQIIEAVNLQAACHFLETDEIDCVILDLGLPDSVGEDTFTKLVERFPVPIIVMTATKDRELAIRMLKAGAADYLLKDYTNDEETFQRIIFAVAKAQGSIRVPNEDMAVFERLDKAQRGIEDARRRRANTDMNLWSAETTNAAAEVSRKMYAELRKLSKQTAQLAAQQQHTYDTVQILDKEMLRGHSGFPPMKTQIELLNHRLGNAEQRLSGLADDVDEVEDTQRREVLRFTETKMTNRTKLLIAILGFLGVVATAVATYLATTYSIQQQPPKPPAGAAK